MGTGKSTVGSALAERLGWTFVDTDERIEAAEGMRITDIFAQRGETGFREAETRVLEQTLSGSAQVVATGGGAVLKPHNCEAMKRGGLVVALTADAETIIGRVKHDRNRPLLQGDLEQRVRSLMAARAHAYDFADLRLETSGVPVADIVDQMISKLQANKGRTN